MANRTDHKAKKNIENRVSAFNYPRYLLRLLFDRDLASTSYCGQIGIQLFLYHFLSLGHWCFSPVIFDKLLVGNNSHLDLL